MIIGHIDYRVERIMEQRRQQITREIMHASLVKQRVDFELNYQTKYSDRVRRETD